MNKLLFLINRDIKHISGKSVYGGVGDTRFCYSKYGLWTSSVSVTWDLVRNAESQAPPRPTESESVFFFFFFRIFLVGTL